MFFAPSLIRKIGKVLKIGVVGFALGMLTCFAVSCAPALDQAGNQVQSSQIERINVTVENRSFDDYTIYIRWEGHTPVRIGRVGSVSTTVIEGVLSHTRNVYFVVKRFPGGDTYPVGPLMVYGGMDVLLVLKNSMQQSIILPVWPKI